MNLNRFQIQVATGRFTLPVVILACLLLWGITFQEWKDCIYLATTILIGYLMIEINTAFTMIRTRTTMPVCIFWAIATSLFFLRPFEWKDLVPLAFLSSVYQLFRSYESSSPATPIYHAFFFISLGSLAFPQLIYLTPILWGCMIPFRSLSGKSLLASLLGIITPYWFLFGYSFYFDQMSLFLAPLKEMIHFYPIEYSHFSISEIASWGTITLLLIISGFHYWQMSYMDKTRTRIYHSFLVIVGLCVTLWSILQPIYMHELIVIELICAAFLSGHLFTLTRNRFSGIFFIVTFIIIILLTIFNLWMQFFNF